MTWVQVILAALALAAPEPAQACENLGVIAFKAGSAEFARRPQGREGFERIAQNPREFYRLMVVGEADNGATTDENFLLAQQRAEALRDHLVALGVMRDQIIIGIRSDARGGGVAWVDTAAGCGQETDYDRFLNSYRLRNTR